ncbi:MAG: prepilin-type N-terminal cleavage/methylation domain-containing protein [Candidatus Dormibacteria bacterium]|jgi:prepilin-type N-terminal cleavage/methylation domain-containing protein
MSAPRGRRTVRTSRQARGGEAGLTLIEMVVTIAIIAIAVVGIAYGFSAIVSSAGNAQVQATLNGAAESVSEYLQSDTDVPYVACATSYRASPPPQFASNYPRVMVDGSAWPASFAVDLSDPAPGPGYSSLGNCSADYGVQEITITVSDGTTSVERTVWKGAQT